MASLDRLHRILKLIEVLQSGRSYNTTRLAEECSVSRRTIFRDLKMLQESGIEVRYDETKQGYSLPARAFLPPTDFTLHEALSLITLCHELGNNGHGIPFQQPARSASLKLLSSLPQHLREHVQEISESITVQIDPRNKLADSKSYYDILMDCIMQKKQVRIYYQSLTEWEDICTLLNPYRMLFCRRSWYVIGRSSLHREIRTFNIGRIKKIEPLESEFRIPARFSLERYLGNAWALIREKGKRYKVKIRFQKMVAYNVAEVAWHKTQKIEWNDDESIDFQVSVDGLNEISWWIMGYGSQAEVLEPPELREIISRNVDEMKKIYDGKSGTGKSTPAKKAAITKASRKKTS